MKVFAAMFKLHLIFYKFIWMSANLGIALCVHVI